MNRSSIFIAISLLPTALAQAQSYHIRNSDGMPVLSFKM
jgi:hypothetical protein